ncbi:31837_t:CDS:1, partial [Racocetra persica]
YNEKLDTLATLQAELVSEINDTPQSKSLIIRSHTYAQEKKSLFFEHVSITQRSEPKHN